MRLPNPLPSIRAAATVVATAVRKIRPRPTIATLLQAGGIATVAFGVGLVAVWAGVIVGGVGMLLFGLAVDLGGRPPTPLRPPAPTA